MTISREELKKAYAEQFQSVGRSSRSAFAETVVNLAEPNHLSLDIFRDFLPTRQVMPGDKLTRRVKKGKYTVRSMVPGTTHMTSEKSWLEQYTFNLDTLIAGIRHNVIEIESGDVDTVEQMRKDLRADITDEIVSRVFTLLGSVWNGTDTPNNWVDATSGGVTATILDNMIEAVTRGVGAVKSITGTREALLPIYKLAGYREVVLGGTGVDRVGFQTTALEEFYRTGKVSSYHGVPLVELPNVRRHRLPGYQDLILDTTKVIVVGENVGEAILYDGPKEQDYTDMRVQPAEYILHTWQSFGVMIDLPEGVGIIKVAPATA